MIARACNKKLGKQKAQLWHGNWCVARTDTNGMVVPSFRFPATEFPLVRPSPVKRNSARAIAYPSTPMLCRCALASSFIRRRPPHSLTLVPDNSAQGKQPGLFCSSHNLVNRFSWVLGVSRLPAKDRRFYPKKEGKLWTITLCPSFESRFARESQNIPKDAKGVYRYIREDGEIVYIGRGNVCGRLASPERESWDFDAVEYSLVEDPDQQIHWERYWLDKFKQAHGRLPFYNKVSGAGSSQEQAE